eukprot:TRINITY_DN10795_c0_g1_i6.p1 TRINITY_DN10795_c0_g1~~TRINITY_DN10795_c0_g1_i6.p1  ORF type:complete len:183 (+),score=37.12 TRINITY_DN10795_c0_g1_i6:312-860(+)
MVAPFIKFNNAIAYFVFSIGATILLQTILSAFNLQDYIFNAPRQNFLDANREGIIGNIGYLIIYSSGLAVGKEFFSLIKQKTVGSLIRKMILFLFQLAAVSGILFYLCFSILGVGESSRRAMNATYIFWTLFQNYFVTALFLVHDLFLRHSVKIDLVEAFNLNQLSYFLIVSIYPKVSSTKA